MHPYKTNIGTYNTCICINFVLLEAELDPSFLFPPLSPSINPAPSNIECANGEKPYRNTTTTNDLEMAGKSESDPFPTRNATSEQIRNFFAQFLSTTMVSIDDAKASEIANRWPHEATGIQLWTFSLQTYRDNFGKMNGMLLWSHVHSVTEDDKEVMFQAMKQPNAIEKSKCCRFISMYDAY